MPEALRLTSSESLIIRESSPDLLEVEATYGPGGSPPPAHLHPSQAENFDVLEGSIRTRVAGEERDLHVGDELQIPRRTSHQIWNPGDAPARVRWQTRPAGRTEEFFRALDRLQRDGKTSKSGSPRAISMLPLLVKFRDVFRLALRPR